MVKSGELDPLKAKIHLEHCGVPMSPPSKVYTGEKPLPKKDGGLFR